MSFVAPLDFRLHTAKTLGKCGFDDELVHPIAALIIAVVFRPADARGLAALYDEIEEIFAQEWEVLTSVFPDPLPVLCALFRRIFAQIVGVATMCDFGTGAEDITSIQRRFKSI